MKRIPLIDAARMIGIDRSGVSRMASTDGVGKREETSTGDGLRLAVTVPESWVQKQIKRREKARAVAAAGK